MNNNTSTHVALSRLPFRKLALVAAIAGVVAHPANAADTFFALENPAAYIAGLIRTAGSSVAEPARDRPGRPAA